MELGPYIDKWGATWKKRVPTGRHQTVRRATTPWPDRSYFEIRVNGVNHTEHEVLEMRLRQVVDEFIAQLPADREA